MRSPLCACAALALSVLLACGDARKVAGDGPDDCSACHEDASALASSIGAHGAHLHAGPFAGPFGCGECHPVPATRLHADGRVEVAFGPVGAANGATPTWDPATGTCAATWCHGRPGGAVNVPSWTGGASQAFCGSCHGLPPPPPHPAVTADSCRGCHVDTMRPDGTIDVAGGKHVDGRVEGGCGGCHALPPATGSHAAHLARALPPDADTYGDLRIAEDRAGASGYAFGCGHCHPLDFSRHPGGGVDLSPAGAPSGSLKARNAADAAYDPGARTCRGTYCHSSGQASPAYAVSPPWGGPSPGCGGCHGNPPRYASGGAGTPTANAHLGLTDTGDAWGHFAGLPGPFHGSKHGVGTDDAAPITCQTCHAETVDPASAGPSGFYWLDTTGDYDVGGGVRTACSDCHAPGDPRAPARAGAVLALRHVNGRRDVAFDARTSLAGFAGGWLPGAPDTPTRPYWVTNGNPGEPTLPPGAGMDGTTLSVELSGARYDPATKTCSGVGCHLGDAPVWGRPYVYQAAPPASSCCRCHRTICG